MQDAPPNTVDSMAKLQSAKEIDHSAVHKHTVLRTNPPYSTMVTEAFQKTEERKGLSLQAVCTYILANYPTANTPNFRFQVRNAIAKGLASGKIKRTKKSQDSRGIQGRFLLDKSKKIIPTDKIPKLKKKPVTPEKKAVKDVASSVAGKKTKTQSIKSEKTNHKKRNKVRSQSLSPAKGKVNKRSKVPPLKTEEKSKTRAKKSSAKVTPSDKPREKTALQKVVKKSTPLKRAKKSTSEKSTLKLMDKKNEVMAKETTKKKKSA